MDRLHHPNPEFLTETGDLTEVIVANGIISVILLCNAVRIKQLLM
ncbi:hypothetical protein SCACP_37360 [Sporomusa carbonis]